MGERMDSPREEHSVDKLIFMAIAGKINNGESLDEFAYEGLELAKAHVEKMISEMDADGWPSVMLDEDDGSGLCERVGTDDGRYTEAGAKFVVREACEDILRQIVHRMQALDFIYNRDAKDAKDAKE